MTYEFTAVGNRLDVEVSENCDMTRSRAASLIKDGCVCADGKTILKAAFKPEAGVFIQVQVPEIKDGEALPQDIPLEILYQDEDLAVVVKPCGMVVHPAAGNPDGTLVNALLFHLDQLSGIGGEMRPGIVHRLDKDTSGLMLVAKNDNAHAFLSQQLAERKMEKHYRAVVFGKMKETQGVIEAPIARSKTDRKKMAIDKEGRYALTEWKLLKQMPDRALLDVHIITGRTHQIRVHMQSIGHPVLGDVIYGHKHLPKAERLMLHAYSLSFTHPKTNERLKFRAPCDFSGEEE